MMKTKILLLSLFLAIAVSFPQGLFAQKTVLTLNGIPEKTIKANGKVLPRTLALKKRDNSKGSALSSETSSDWSGTQETDELVDEDFSKFTAGTNDAPDKTSLCDIYGKFGPQRENIPDEYTSKSGWCGNWVFQAGGAAALIDSYGGIGAFINTPLGDFSGDLTVTIRVKNIGDKTAGVLINVDKGGYYDPVLLGSGKVSLKKNSDWRTIEVKYHNTYAGNDGFVQIATYNQCVIDYIKVTNTYNFLAAPRVLEPTNFTSRGFTVNWEPVRMAASYDLWIFRKVYTSTSDSVFAEKFEDGVPQKWEFGGNAHIADAKGAESSSAVVLNNGDYLSSPVTLGRYKNFSTFMKVEANGATTDELNNGRVEIWLRTIDSWKKLGEMNAAGYLDGKIVDMQEKTKNAFSNQFYGVRIVANLLGDAELILDNADGQIGPSARLDPVGAYEAAGMRYANTSETSYTFTNLAPKGEYYYGVASFSYGKTSTYSLNYAFGVAKPTAKPATDVTADGFTANWASVAKATGYRINNYGIYNVKKAGKYATITEDFSKISETVSISSNPFKAESLNNDYSMDLGKYTTNAGWKGKYTQISNGYLGFSGSGSLVSPQLDLSNSDHFSLYIKAVGTPGDVLKIESGSNVYNVDVVADPTDETGAKGMIDAAFDVPESGGDIQLKFYSYAGVPIMFDAIKISQDLKEGDKVKILLSSENLPKSDLSKIYTQLDTSKFKEFAYQVYALFEDVDGRTAVSDPSDLITVNLNGSVNSEKSVTPTDIDSIASGSDITVVGFYSIEGKKLSVPQKGFNIVRYSDGSVKKIFMR